MKKLIQKLSYMGKLTLFGVVLFAILGILSLMAVSLSYFNPNSPILPVCPIGEEPSTLVGAADSDGMVRTVAIHDVSVSNRKIQVRLNNDGNVEGKAGAGDWRLAMALQEVIPAQEEGGALAAHLSIFDAIPAGKYQITLVFANNDPIPQTATCKLALTVLKQTTPEGPRTFYSVKSRERASTQTETTRFINRILIGIIPGVIVLGLTIVGAGRFMRTFYEQKFGTGLRFLSYCIFGRPSPKRPVLLVTPEGELGGDEIAQKVGGPALMVLRKDYAKAVILEQGGKFTQVAYGMAYIQLKPFEKIWDVVDLRPQRWVYEVGAITKDGIFIQYKADVQFQIDIPDDNSEAAKANVFKAATSKWIRDAHRTEVDRLMTWDKRLIIGIMEGNLRRILAHYNLDDLIEGDRRREIRKELQEVLDKAAPNFGAKILSVELHDVKFGDKVLEPWFKEWQARCDARVQPILARGRAQRIKAREQATNQVRQDLLSHTIEILQQMAQDKGWSLEQVSEKYILLSFIEMLRASNKTPAYMSDYVLRTLVNLQMVIEGK